MQHLPHLPPTWVIRLRASSYGYAGLVLLPSGGLRPRLEGGTVGDAVEPASERCRLPNRTGVVGEDEAGGLEGVLGVGLVAEHAAADLQHHWPMTAHQGMEDSLLLLGSESLEQFLVRQVPQTPVFHRSADQ